jgi:hypothetical protein
MLFVPTGSHDKDAVRLGSRTLRYQSSQHPVLDMVADERRGWIGGEFVAREASQDDTRFPSHLMR